MNSGNIDIVVVRVDRFAPSVDVVGITNIDTAIGVGIAVSHEPSLASHRQSQVPNRVVVIIGVDGITDIDNFIILALPSPRHQSSTTPRRVPKTSTSH